jgi:hypothetical protein
VRQECADSDRERGYCAAGDQRDACAPWRLGRSEDLGSGIVRLLVGGWDRKVGHVTGPFSSTRPTVV